MHTRELPVKLEPWALFRVLARKERPFFIDAGRPWGDEWISSMGFRPRMQFRVGANESGRGALDSLDDALAGIAANRATSARPHPVPFAGGVVLALAYEAKNEIERLSPSWCEDPAAPHLVAATYDAAVSYDHRRRRYVVASWHLEARELARYADEVMTAVADAARSGAEELGQLPGRGTCDPRAAGVTASLDLAAYTERVARVRAYLAAGDVYQVNLSLRLEAPLRSTPLTTYGRMRALQPVPFGAFLDLGSTRVLSNSPELFLRRRGDRVETCPIKGTRPRGHDARSDARLVDELRSDAKERAEHVMIVDLERNDLGRVCRTGSVRVSRFADLVTLPTLHHLVSSVRGTLASGIGAADLLRATFPSGSITGAPKIRAMEIIDELEGGPRGFYTGALGWIDASGDLDLNVAIRTAVVGNGRIAYSVGSGIVADSDTEREHAECQLKADAFLRALGGGACETTAADRRAS